MREREIKDTERKKEMNEITWKEMKTQVSLTPTPFKITINFASLVFWNCHLLALGLGTYIGEVKRISLKVQHQHNNLPCQGVPKVKVHDTIIC